MLLNQFPIPNTG